jgi:protein O-GlcNAc transferase
VTVLDPVATLTLGLEHHQAGRAAQAEAAYRAVLARAPRQPDALHLLAVLMLQQGGLAEGIGLARQAVKAGPQQPTFWNTLGMAERAGGRLGDAVVALTRATALAPEYAEAWANLAAVQQERGDPPAEAAALAQLTAILPAHAPSWGRRGVLAYLRGHLDEAAGHFGQAVALAPDDAEAWSNLGATQTGLGQYAAAETSLRRAVALRPDAPDPLGNLGAVLVASAQWQAALTVLERLVALAPDRPNGWLNLGRTHRGLGQPARAAAAFERALTLTPDDPAALRGLGDARFDLGELLAAIDCYEHALAGSPRDPDTYEHLELTIQALGRPAADSTEPSTVAEDLRRLVDALRDALRYGLTDDASGCLPAWPQTASYAIVALDLMEGAEAEAQALRQRWNARFGGAAQRPASGQHQPHASGQCQAHASGQHQPPASGQHEPHANPRDPHRRLHVGYVSADFRHHSAANAILPILRSHDRSQVTVYCYSGVTVPDPVTGLCQQLADQWRDTAHLSDEQMAALIRQDEIDVLVDLSGHSRANRLTVFSRQPAPVQVTAWGYATGTGLDTIGYFLADEVVVPEAARAFYSEMVVNLPSVFCYEPPAFSPPVAPSPAATRGHITFGAFNRLTKITPEVIAAWGRVLQAVPDARLIVKSGGLEVGADRDLLLSRLAAQGVSLDRVTVRGTTPQGEHLAAHGDVDLLLDTFPHTGGITTLDALYMGVPTVTLLGERVSGRVSASFLMKLGLGDMVAETVDQYVEIATRLAADPRRLARERSTLRERLLASPIADAPAFTRAVEAAYRAMWQRWCTDGVPTGVTTHSGRSQHDIERSPRTHRLTLNTPRRSLHA